MAFSIAKCKSIYIYDVKVSDLQGSSYIYDTSRLRVKYTIVGGYMFRPIRGHLQAIH
jgi:hypothetical protein